MKLKLDENLGLESKTILSAFGYDVCTVREQNLCSSSDQNLAAVCKKEQRCLVTLDLDFANPLLFQHSDYFGMAVLRLPNKPSATDLIDTLKTLAQALSTENISGKLWIVQKNKIRLYKPADEADEFN